MPDLDWIEARRSASSRSKPDGTIERWYGDSLAHTLLLTRCGDAGHYLDGWREGVRLGAVRRVSGCWSPQAPSGWKGGCASTTRGTAASDSPGCVRLSEWPVVLVDENALYRLVEGGGRETLRLGAELKAGVPVEGSHRLVVERAPARTP